MKSKLVLPSHRSKKDQYDDTELWVDISDEDQDVLVCEKVPIPFSGGVVSSCEPRCNCNPECQCVSVTCSNIWA
jgi:hypothetical protein